MGCRRGTPEMKIWGEHVGPRDQTPTIQFVGISLGWDFTAEHEHGIEELQETLGLKTKKLGVERMKVHNASSVFLKEDGEDLWMFVDSWGEGRIPSERELYYMTHGDNQDISTGWCESAFVIRTKNEDFKKDLTDLYDAFKKKNAVVFLGSRSTPFSNAGLALAIFDRLPQVFVDQALAGDKDHAAMLKAAKKTKIESRLNKAGMTWFGLKPKWKPEDTESEYPVVFWLNPREQKKNNAGWFTVENLEQWMQNEGPIPIK